MNILLIDDHSLFTLSLKKVLEESDSVDCVHIVKNTKGIDEFIIHNNVSIILLDIHLGEENGFEIGRYLKKHYPKLPVAFLTGFDFAIYKSTAVEIGVEGFFNKTIDPNNLISELNKIIKNPFPLKENEFNDRLILTKREIQILNLLADGMKQNEIADNLNISRRTVQSIIYHIYEKLEVNTASSATIKGIEFGLIKLRS
ncbi:response regulator transcription factor [Eubacterium limosum]|uniref:response regulator transcription factor n=1 Tax=Eubacterium limosum TaxID=1736 RepID=UPI0010644350|nr:response regulator transcription factor [Eubacterium limosum]